MAGYELPDGYNYAFGGMMEMMNDSFRSLGLAMVVAVLLVFTVLYYAGALNRSTPNLLTEIGYSIILAVSLNLVVGFLGELSACLFFFCQGFSGLCQPLGQLVRSVRSFPSSRREKSMFSR